MGDSIAVGCDIPFKHNVSPVLSEMYPPQTHKFSLYFDYFTVLREFNSTYAIRFHCQLNCNNNPVELFTGCRYFSYLFCAVLQNKLLELGFSHDALTIGVKWHTAIEYFLNDFRFYLKVYCNKQVLVECDPYYRWVNNG